MAYLIDTLTIPADLADYDAEIGNSDVVATQEWRHSYATLAEAESAYDELTEQRHILAAALIEWHPGDIDVPTDFVPEAGHWAERNCIGGIPTRTLVRHGYRTWTYYLHAESGSMLPTLRSVTGSEWHNDSEHVGCDLTTQPGPGHKLSCPQYGRDGARVAA
jgi:hypothetical protein